MRTIVLNLGGSVLAPDAVDVAYVRKAGGLLQRLARSHRVLVVVGGGRVARRYIEAARELGANETFLDEMGIEATRLNARLLIAASGASCCPQPPTGLHEAMLASRTHAIVVMGGTHPGHTTDAVTAMLGERAGALRVVIGTNVRGVYSADPRTHPRARFLPKVTGPQLVAITRDMAATAGPAGVMDPLAARIVARSGVPTSIVDCRDLRNVEAAARGRRFRGTIVVGSKRAARDHR